MCAGATRWFVVAAIVAAVAAALVGVFDLASGAWTRATIGFPIALVAAAGIAEFGPDLKPRTRRHERVATAIDLAVFGICLIAGIVATDRTTSADEASRYIGYFVTLVVAKYVADGIVAVGTRGWAGPSGR
jgi:uncharacterized membrane protein YidH (DUF202 family)